MITDRWLTDTVQLTRQYQNVASASVYGIDFISPGRRFFVGISIDFTKLK
jgi:hypothetical protein